MALVSDLRRQVDARMKELESAVEEYEQLKRIAATLPAEETQTARRSSRGRARTRAKGGAAAKSSTTGTRRRAPGGNAEHVMRLVAERPGISVADVAKAMGIGTTYLLPCPAAPGARGPCPERGARLSRRRVTPAPDLAGATVSRR